MESVSRRSVLKAAGGLAAASAGAWWLSGCAPAYNTGAKKTINFWAFSDTRIFWQKKAWDLYKQQKKPDFEINWLIFPYQQMHDKILITSQAGSGGPDIADIEIGQFSRYIKGDTIFVDLKPKLEAMGVLDKLFKPSATDPWTWKGKIYGMGNELNTCLMAYRFDLLEKANIKVPFETWDDFIEAGKKYHQDTGKYLIEQPYSDAGYWWVMTLQQGGGYFGQSGQPTVNAAPAIKTATYMQQAIKDGWSTPRPLSASYNAQVDSGIFATILGPSWNFSGFTQENAPHTKGKWHLQPLPYWTPGSGSRTATWGGTGVSVLKTSQSVEEALDFVTFEHTTPQALLYDFDERQVWPTFKPALDDPRLSQPLEFFDNQKVGELIKEVSPEINTWYNSPYWPETVDATIRVGLSPTILQPGTVTAEQAMNNAQHEALSIISFESA
jgi:arabinosaccharide transport system substrate-binding protein